MEHKDAIRTNPYTVYNGVAAEDLAHDSVTLPVICPELMPHSAVGVVGAGTTTSNTALQDRDGNPITSQIVNANHIVATWEGASNSRYPPLIVKGEPVEIFQNTSQDKYLWRPTGRGRDFRKTDRVCMEISASDPTKPAQTKDDTNTWSAHLDSQNGTFGLKTSKANNEKVAWSIQGDVKAGTFHLSDDSEDPANRFVMDTGAVSGVPSCQINLSTGLTFRMEGKNLYISVPGKTILSSKDRLIFDSPLLIFNPSGKGTIIFSALQMSLNATKDVILTAGNVIGLNATSTKISGTLVSASARITKAVKGVFGSGYKGASIQKPLESPVTDANNASDTDTSGTPYQ